MERIGVTIFTNSFRIGGSERQAVELIKRLDRRRFDVTVACFRRVGPLLEELDGYVAEVHEFPLTAFHHPGTLRQAGRFAALLRRTGPRIVQCFDFYSNLFAIPVARLAGVPVVLASRRDEGTMRTRAQGRAERLSFALATGLVANAQVIKDRLLAQARLRPERVFVVPNGLDVARFDDRMKAAPAPEDGDAAAEAGAVTVAVVANLRPEKGHGVFLDAARLVAASEPRARFLVAGDGPDRDRIAAAVGEGGLRERVRLLGEVRNVPGFLRDVDIAVLPSLTNEGFPNAAMEAMAAGRPVVATDTGGTRELVIDGLTGWLVPPGDAAALADRLLALCRDADLRRTMGAAGRWRVVEHFTAEQMAARFACLYRDLLDGRRPLAREAA